MRRQGFLLPLLGAVCFLGSCLGNRTYDHYEHTPLAGWEKNDSLFFEIPRVAAAGTYRTNLGLRINGSYPFMGLTLIVEQTVYPRKSKVNEPVDRLIRKSYTDTLTCNLIDTNGRVRGKGVSSYQYHFHITNLQLNAGDSVHVCVRHDMKQEILPGISDIGIEYIRK